MRFQAGLLSEEDRLKIRKRLMEMSKPEIASAFSRMTRTPAKGTIHRWDEPPFPFGATIKPTSANQNFKPEVRQMVIGPASTKEATTCLDLGDEVESPSFRMWVHLNENMHERWEIADE